MNSFKPIVISLLVVFILACTNKKSGRENISEAAVKSSSVLQSTVLMKGIDTWPNTSVIYNSVDGGKTWAPFDAGIPDDATVSALLVSDDRIIASTDYHGIYSITDGEKEWKRIDDDLPKNIDINAISVIDAILLIGTLKHGILISKNGGRNWTNPAKQITNTSIRSLYTNGNILFAGADNGIYKSLDKGNTWEYVWKGVQVNGFAGQNQKIFAALMNGAIMSDDNGLNWEYVYKPHTLHDISTDGERIYAMTLGDGLKKSSNYGLTWENINSGLGTSNLYTFEVKRFDQMIFAAQWYGIYASGDWGKSWSFIRNGLPDSTAFTTLEATRYGLIAGIGLREKQ